MTLSPDVLTPRALGARVVGRGESVVALAPVSKAILMRLGSSVLFGNWRSALSRNPDHRNASLSA
ncbi:MAG: hypothetical protein ACK5CF_06530 [Opitutaceae bacterium]|jgi:hypothetical protein